MHVVGRASRSSAVFGPAAFATGCHRLQPRGSIKAPSQPISVIPRAATLNRQPRRFAMAADVRESAIHGARRVGEVLWEIPPEARPGMRVPARLFADEELFAAIASDGSLAQIENVAMLPGIAVAALAMPDAHQGYGFPVGGVAATELPDGVVSPGGVGYDINCGVRLLALPLTEDVLGERREPLVHEISRAVPAGAGKRSRRAGDLDAVLLNGPRALNASEDDVERTESEGCLPGADPTAVSDRARQRGEGQLGTMGSGNHFVELQRVERVLDEPAAEAYGLREDQVTVLIHS